MGLSSEKVNQEKGSGEVFEQKTKTKCVGLHVAALKGDWDFALSFEGDLDCKITDKAETALHIAAAARQIQFVENLVNRFKRMDLKLKTYSFRTLTYLESENTNGNTALCYAAATGIIKIAKVMIDAYEELYYAQNHVKQEEDNLLPNRGKIKPVFTAAMLGHGEMVRYLLDKTNIGGWSKTDRAELFISCIGIGLYDVALQMLKTYSELATAQNECSEAALHVLARKPSAFVLESGQSWRKYLNLGLKVKNNENTPSKALKLVRELCELSVNNPDMEKADPKPMMIIAQSLLIAAEEGNTELLIELIRFDPNLIWKVHPQNGSIFHIAVRYRHESIFSLIFELGSIMDLIATNTVSGENNMLHLAAKLAPQNQLSTISGAALQMQRELFWFKEVEKIVQPSYKEMKNEEGKTPQVLFQEEHKELMRAGEKWMRETAKSSMLVAALICAVTFSTAFSTPTGGYASFPWWKQNVETGKSFWLFSIFDASALFLSSISVMMFLSILSSRFADEDFLRSLPTRLMIGVASLFMSVAAMMGAFLASISAYCHGYCPWICGLCLFSCALVLYVAVKNSLLISLIRSSFDTWSMRSHNRLF